MSSATYEYMDELMRGLFACLADNHKSPSPVHITVASQGSSKLFVLEPNDHGSQMRELANHMTPFLGTTDPVQIVVVADGTTSRLSYESPPGRVKPSSDDLTFLMSRGGMQRDLDEHADQFQVVQGQE